MNSVFSDQILADKLSKLNSTQQCIETLSHWCIFHRQKAAQVVQTWDKQFHSSDKERKIPYLYLANDILQNSKRKGNEFVTEFWKVLPAALKEVAKTGEEHGRSVVHRLVGIWEERRVFGSHSRSLKELMTGTEPLPELEFNKKRTRSVRIMKKDSRSVKIKLSVGGTPERIVSAFHGVLSEHPTEDSDLKRCKDTVHRLGKMEKHVNAACLKAKDPQRVTLVDRIQEEESFLKECIEKLKSVEASRVELVARLKEALQGQESELENVRTQLQVAEAQISEAANMRRRLKEEEVTSSNPSTTTPPKMTASEQPKKTAAAIAAEVADRLAASTHSQQIMTSVLSTFAAEEAKNAKLKPSNQATTAAVDAAAQEKRTKLEKPMAVAGNNFVVTQPLVGTAPGQQQYQTMMVPQQTVQTQSSVSQQQYTLVPGSAQHFMQPGGQLMIGLPYTYNTLPPPPPPPPPPPQVVNVARPPQITQPIAVIQQQQQLQPPMALQQPMSINQQLVPMNMQQPIPPSYRPLQPPGINFYHHPSQ